MDSDTAKFVKPGIGRLVFNTVKKLQCREGVLFKDIKLYLTTYHPVTMKTEGLDLKNILRNGTKRGIFSRRGRKYKVEVKSKPNEKSDSHPDLLNINVFPGASQQESRDFIQSNEKIARFSKKLVQEFSDIVADHIPIFSDVSNEVVEISLNNENQPLNIDQAISLRNLLFGSEEQTFSSSWNQQGIHFRTGVAAYGIIQNAPGPCGFIAALQAYCMLEFLFDYSKVLQKSGLKGQNIVFEIKNSDGVIEYELINLMLTGAAVTNTFDGEIVLDYDNQTILQGVAKQSTIGFLSVFEFSEMILVGNYLKSPAYPIWVIAEGTHYTTLFSSNKIYTKLEESYLKLHHYDSLRKEAETLYSLKPCTEEKDVKVSCLSPVLKCIITKWPFSSIEVTNN